MNSTIPDTKTEMWPINTLKRHPAQDSLFKVPTPDDIATLAKDMALKGMKTPMEILPDGTILCGHSRYSAAQQLGWTEVEVIVLHELAEQGEVAILKHLIDDNRVRRQLTPLDESRCLKAEFDIAKKQKTGTFKGSFRDAFAKKYNMSGRNLERRLNVLNTPMEVQMAFDDKKLPLIEASKVAGLKKEAQQEIANAIRAGETPRTAVAKHFSKLKTWKQEPEQDIATYLRPLKNWKRAMKPRLPDIATVRECDGQMLVEVKNLIEVLLKLCPAKSRKSKTASPKARRPKKPATMSDSFFEALSLRERLKIVIPDTDWDAVGSCNDKDDGVPFYSDHASLKMDTAVHPELMATNA